MQAEVVQQREQIARLVERVRDLEARLAKDSHNSGKPPSSDGFKRQLPRTRSLRRKTGKKPGGQLGHTGETLHLVAEPDEIVEHRPSVCATCQTTLEAGAGAEIVGRERRQVQELPPIRLRVSEHQALSVRCRACQQVTVGVFPTEASSRAQYGPRLRALVVYLVAQQFVPYARTRDLLADLTGAPLSVGTLVEWVQQSAATRKPVETDLKAALHRARVLHSDETGVRREGRLAWAHVASTPRLTHYAIHAKRGTEATDAIGILPGYRGVSVHDGWKPYQASTSCHHALCNVHHLRELTFVEEQYEQSWAKDRKALLLEMRAATEQAREQGQPGLPVSQRDTLVTASVGTAIASSAGTVALYVATALTVTAVGWAAWHHLATTTSDLTVTGGTYNAAVKYYDGEPIRVRPLTDKQVRDRGFHRPKGGKYGATDVIYEGVDGNGNPTGEYWIGPRGGDNVTPFP